jgi:hypothetical protein
VCKGGCWRKAAGLAGGVAWPARPEVCVCVCGVCVCVCEGEYAFFLRQVNLHRPAVQELLQLDYLHPFALTFALADV